MPSHPLRAIVRQANPAHDLARLSDAQLLERFVTTQDALAFEIIVRRHGPMIMGVCRRALRNPHDAEDAFQATFLVLVRKAGSVQPREMLPNFLHGVAYQITRKAKFQAAKRQARERQVAQMPEPEAGEPDTSTSIDLQHLLDQEVRQLPEKYRLVVVLCDLQGKTRAEAAEQLGWPEGTVSGRLSRARKMLGQRLTRRGVTLSGGVPLASVPATVIRETVEIGGQVAANPAVAILSPEVATLTEEVVKTMTMSKFRVGAVVLLALALVGSSVGLTLSKPPTDAPAEKPTQVQSQPQGNKKEDEQNATRAKVKSLQIQRRDLLKKAVDALYAQFEAGRITGEPVTKAARLLLQAELDVATKQEERIAAHAAQLKLAKSVEVITTGAYKAGRMTAADHFLAQCDRLEAEIGWLQAGGKEGREAKRQEGN